MSVWEEIYIKKLSDLMKVNISHRMFKGLCVWFMGVLIFTIPFFVAQPTCEAYRVLCRKGAWQIISGNGAADKGILSSGDFSYKYRNRSSV